MTSPPDLPKSIDVWVCPTCGRLSWASLGRDHMVRLANGIHSVCPGEPARHRFVPAEPIEELRDLIGDAIERGLSEPLRIAEGENEETVRALARAAAAGNPDTMRRVVLIQRAVVSALSTSQETGDRP